MKKLFFWFDKLIRALLLILTVSLVVVGFAQIFTRYVLKTPLPWSEEMLRFLFIYTTFVGVPIGVMEGRHATVDLLLQKIPARFKRGYTLVLHSLMGIVFAVMLIWGAQYAAINTGQLSGAMRIPMCYVLASVPIGGGVGLVYWVKHMADIWKGEVEK